jgi:hypothetical protein
VVESAAGAGAIMTFVEQLVIFLIGQIVLSASIWGAIRGDIKALHENDKNHENGIKEAKEIAGRAHVRIDSYIAK